MIMLLPAIALLTVTALFLNAALGLKQKLAYLVSFYLLAYAAIVIVCQAASLFRSMSPGFFLLAHSLLALGAWTIWKRRQSPNLRGPFQGLSLRKEDLRAWLKTPDLAFLAACVGAAYLVGLLLILLTPQNNFDSLTYHLSRVGYWLQHNSLFPWDTPNPRQTSFPINAELGILWTVIFLKTDQLSGLIQWIALPVTGAVITGFAWLLGANQKQSLFAALIWVCFPENILQSTTTMNDLVVTAFFSSAVYLGILGIREKSRPALILAGLGVGLAMGTKSTAFIFMPGFGMACVILWLQNWRGNFRPILTWGISSLAAFALVGAWVYAQNLIFYQNPLSVTEWTEGIVSPQKSRGQLFSENFVLYLNQAVDWTGAPPAVYEPLIKLQAKVVQKLISFIPAAQEERFISSRQNLNFILYSPKSIHEDLAWFGPLSILLLTPTSLYHIVLGIKRKDSLRLALAALTIGFCVTICLLFGWTPYKGRYFTLAVPFATPFMAVLFQPGKAGAILRWLIVGASVYLLSRAVLLNQSKPLLGEAAIWGKDRLSIQVINNPGFTPVMRMVESRVPAGSRLATKLSVNSWDYLLFGENFSRSLIPVDPFATSIDPHWLTAQQADYLLVEPKERVALGVPAGFALVEEVNGWTLYAPCPGETCPPDAEAASRLLGTADRDRLLTIAPELAGQIGVLELRTVTWGIEQFEGKGILWLGEGPRQGLTGYLWSESAGSAQIQVQIEPGPAKASPLRTLAFTFAWVKGYETLEEGLVQEERQFDQDTTITFTVKLHAGLHEFRLNARDIAEFRGLPNGDTRPLLALVKGIWVTAAP